MKILFGTTNYGKDISEVDSGFLLWIIEKMDEPDWSLLNAAKKELAARLKLDWSPPADKEVILSRQVKELEHAAEKLLKQIDLLEKCLIMSTCFGATRINVDGYLRSPKYLEQHLQIIREINNPAS